MFATMNIPVLAAVDPDVAAAVKVDLPEPFPLVLPFPLVALCGQFRQK